MRVREGGSVHKNQAVDSTVHGIQVLYRRVFYAVCVRRVVAVGELVFARQGGRGALSGCGRKQPAAALHAARRRGRAARRRGRRRGPRSRAAARGSTAIDGPRT